MVLSVSYLGILDARSSSDNDNSRSLLCLIIFLLVFGETSDFVVASSELAVSLETDISFQLIIMFLEFEMTYTSDNKNN